MVEEQLMTGQAWECEICHERMDSLLANIHWAEHMKKGDRAPDEPVFVSSPGTFYGYSVAVGVIGAIVFTVLHHVPH